MVQDNVVEADEDRKFVDSLEKIGRFIPKTVVTTTHRKISEKILEHNKFENHVLLQTQTHALTRGTLYRSFKRNGEIDVEVN